MTRRVCECVWGEVDMWVGLFQEEFAQICQKKAGRGLNPGLDTVTDTNLSSVSPSHFSVVYKDHVSCRSCNLKVN